MRIRPLWFCFLVYVFLLGSVCSAGEAPGQESINHTQHEWSKYFDGTPIISDDLADYEPLFRIDHSFCGAPVRDVLNLVASYSSNMSKNQPEAADEAYHEIETALKSKERPSCSVPVAQAYVAASMFILFKKNPRFFSESGHPAYRDGVGVSHEALLKTILLINEGKIHFLRQKNKNIRGAYDCGNSDIYIFLNQRPFDVAASLVHEFDHFLRDKFIPLDFLTSRFPPNQPAQTKVDWRTYMLLDELLASAEATFAQASFKYDLDTTNRGLEWVAMDKPYMALHDLSFIGPNRPLQKFITYTHDFPHEVLLSRGISEARWKYINLFERNEMKQFNINKANSYLLDDFNLISNSYFKNAIDAHQWKELSVSFRQGEGSYTNLPDDSAELIFNTDFYQGLFRLWDTAWLTEDPKYWVPIAPLKTSFADGSLKYANIEALFDFSLKIEQSLSTPSEQCLDFQKAEALHLLDDYLGTDFRPGNGAKTGESSKPGNGAKTGTEIKPGNGAKTSVTIRPCILPSEKL